VVKRGNTVIAVFGGVLGGKPRPAVIFQDDRFNGPVTILAIPFTSGLETASVLRPVVEPDDTNGLDEPSCSMTDKLFPVRREMIGQIIGMLADQDMERIELAVQIILGMKRSDVLTDIET
jgi:mRNA interferase MazF